MLPQNRVLSKPSDIAKQLAALARLIAYARHEAQSLHLTLPAYCLDMAFVALIEEMQANGADTAQILAGGEHVIGQGIH